MNVFGFSLAKNAKDYKFLLYRISTKWVMNLSTKKCVRGYVHTLPALFGKAVTHKVVTTETGLT